MPKKIDPDHTFLKLIIPFYKVIRNNYLSDYFDIDMKKKSSIPFNEHTKLANFIRFLIFSVRHLDLLVFYLKVEVSTEPVIEEGLLYITSGL